MESYIVRIYRREEENPREVVGVVEEVEAEDKKAFRNMDELLEILASPRHRLPYRSRAGPQKANK